MSLWTLAIRSLRFYWRTNIAVALAVVVTTAVLTGALVLGDSVRHTLRMIVQKRLGNTELAIISPNRFFRAALADDLRAELKTNVAPVLQVRAIMANSSGRRRANRVEVLGIDERFFQIGAVQNQPGKNGAGDVILNKQLAKKLGVGAGDEIVLRIEKPGKMPRDVPLMPDSDLSIAFRLTVKAVASDTQFGRFSLQANQLAPLNAFVSIEWLQEKLDRNAQVNLLLVAGGAQDKLTAEEVDEAIKRCWQLADASLELRQLEKQNVLELRSKRIFIDKFLTDAAIKASDDAVGILTYFVNEIRLGDRVTPYSFISAVARSDVNQTVIPDDMADDEILISRWLADDLEAHVGDKVQIRYYVIGPMRKLVEQQSSFRIKSILPMDSPALDPELMPNFPGLADVENCRDWEPGIAIDLDRIRERDEDYWDQYRGTPKAIVTLQAGQAIWANRYGNLTAVRYPLSAAVQEQIAKKLLQSVEPALVGLFAQPVRERGLQAGQQATDFGQLFLGLSMFLIAAAVLLLSLVFVFGVQSRTEQIGMLLAIGFEPRLVKRLLIIEGGFLALLGAICGTAVGIFYTKSVIYGLKTVWLGAVSGSEIQFYAKSSTLLIGGAVAIIVCLLAIWLTLRWQVARPARELLAADIETQFLTSGPLSRGKTGLLIATIAVIAAVVLIISGWKSDSRSAAGIFFGAGALLLIASLSISRTLLMMIGAGSERTVASLAGLGLRNSARRPGRSLAVIASLACGIFLVIAIGANRHDSLINPHRRDSGTGGFALYGESTISILNDLDDNSVRRSLGLEKTLAGAGIVQLRVHDGDDASCLNLNRAQKPRLLGVEPEQLYQRSAFTFTDVVRDAPMSWQLLNANFGDDVVSAIGDYPTIVWALGKSVGDELQYTDEMGRRFRLRIVGMLEKSILQGSLIIPHDKFIERFPSEDGYRAFLIDAPKDRVKIVAEGLSVTLTDFGLSLTFAAERLASFNVVENTYLSIFQMLGGLGLILGSIGLGVLVLRNVLERRGELATLRAVGYLKSSLKWMVFYEHWGLALGGLICGTVAAMIAVWPALGTSAKIPYLSLSITIVLIVLSSMIWIRVATAVALRGDMLEALRNE
jgi:putative ABC transport system permease protein